MINEFNTSENVKSLVITVNSPEPLPAYVVKYKLQKDNFIMILLLYLCIIICTTKYTQL